MITYIDKYVHAIILQEWQPFHHLFYCLSLHLPCLANEHLENSIPSFSSNLGIIKPEMLMLTESNYRTSQVRTSVLSRQIMINRQVKTSPFKSIVWIDSCFNEFETRMSVHISIQSSGCTAIWITPMQGLFQSRTRCEFIRIQCNTTNNPGFFQHRMESLLSRYLWKTVLVYIDDVIVFSQTQDEQSWWNAWSNCVSLSLGKYHFGYNSLIALGHCVPRFSLAMHEDESKPSAIWHTLRIFPN